MGAPVGLGGVLVFGNGVKQAPVVIGPRLDGSVPDHGHLSVNKARRHYSALPGASQGRRGPLSINNAPWPVEGAKVCPVWVFPSGPSLPSTQPLTPDIFICRKPVPNRQPFKMGAPAGS